MTEATMHGGRGRVRRCAVALAVTMTLGGCATLGDGIGYYWQSVSGHLSMVRAARPVDELIDDPSTDARLKARLELARDIRRYASERLGLPDNGSYRRYADLGRPYVVWNVFAAPELSLKLEQWCFPVVGCVTYRGYYEREAAERYAARLRERGLETHLGGVPAYSTLGWFDDPLLNTFVRYPDGELARLIFHELAHQVVFVAGDTSFNESFATAVEEVGVERWLAERATPAQAQAYAAWAARRREFLALVLRHKKALERAYEEAADDDARRRSKAEILQALQDDYATVKRERWNGFVGYDRFFNGPITNAHLASVSTYTEQVPAFRALLAREGNDLPRFYRAVRELSRLGRDERRAALRKLAPPDATEASDDAEAAGDQRKP